MQPNISVTFPYVFGLLRIVSATVRSVCKDWSDLDGILAVGLSTTRSEQCNVGEA